jgi:hypothetical protein
VVPEAGHRDGLRPSTLLAIPGLVRAPDEVQADPDSVYLTVDASSGLDNSVRPGNGETHDMNAGQVAHPSITVPFGLSMSLTLGERTPGASTTTIRSARSGSTRTTRVGGHVAQVASSDVEGLFFYVT